MEKRESFPIFEMPAGKAEERVRKIMGRNLTFDGKLLSTVADIIRNVREGGDSSLLRYTKEFDGVSLKSLKVPAEEVELARRSTNDRTLSILSRAVENVRRFHEKQRQNSWTTQQSDGTILGQRVIPLGRVAVYVPGGTAAYPSTVIMNVVPAQVAGVGEIAVFTPPTRDGSVNQIVLATCGLLGVTEVYAVGGAQAIAAAAYGTESVRRADKIVGPGNIYVAAAKKLVYGDVDVDMIAGPSEVVVLADSGADAGEIAADLLAQAEHDVNAAAILVTTDRALARRVRKKIQALLKELPRKKIAAASIERNGAAFVAGTTSDAIDLVNRIAPEHLEVIMDDEWDILGRIRNAGAVFLGRYSPEPVGDYFAGPSHVLPTGGTARFSSVLNVDSFVKKSSVIRYSKAAFERDSADIAVFAEDEGLTAHALSIRIRKDGKRKR